MPWPSWKERDQLRRELERIREQFDFVAAQRDGLLETNKDLAKRLGAAERERDELIRNWRCKR
jgi:hypothetical protein